MGKKWLVSALAFSMLASVVAPAMAQDGRQKDKNNMRNLGVGAGAAAAYEALRGHGTNALILGAGAAYAGKKYEDSRKAQSKANGYRRVYRYQDGRRVGYTLYKGDKRVRYVSLRSA